jgi:hypothetical protein
VRLICIKAAFSSGCIDSGCKLFSVAACAMLRQVIILTSAITLTITISTATAVAKPQALACPLNGLPDNVLGFCTAPLFKSYVSCIEKWLPNWDPNGNVLKKRAIPLATAVLAVLMECEPIARKFGDKYGNEFANILQSVANRRVSMRYGTHPLVTPLGDKSTFLEYGETVTDPAVLQQGGALHDDLNGGFRRPVSPESTDIVDLLKPGLASSQTQRACKLEIEIDGANAPCDQALYVEFNNGESSVQFNKQTGDNPMVSFFGTARDADTISVEHVIVKNGNPVVATGQCILSTNEATCQARIADGRMVIGTIFPNSQK